MEKVIGYPGGLVVKNPTANARDIGDTSSITGLGRSLGRGNGKPLQYSCLGKPMNRRAWLVTVQGVARVKYDLGTKSPYLEKDPVKSQ